MDVAVGPPPAIRGMGDRGVSDLVLTQENKPKAHPIAKHMLIYMEACELPPVSVIGHTPYRPRA